MHAALRSLDSPDLAPETLETYKPPLPDDFGILLMAFIGPSDGAGEELFHVTVCSSKWLARATMAGPTKGYEFQRARLVVSRWDPDLFRRAISDLCLHAIGADWSDVANKLSRYLDWEFEGYTPT